MNYLAHLFLAEDSAPSLIGSIMPDLVRGRIPKDGNPPELLAAVDMHRRVDAFTDTHAVVARGKVRLRERHGHFSAVLIDVYYDYFLATNWHHYAAIPLIDFVVRVHEAFTSHRHLLPATMAGAVDRMMEQDWLRSYADIQGLRKTLSRMSQRLSQRLERPVHLHHGVEDLLKHHKEFDAEFHEFFPQVIAYVGGKAPWRKPLKQPSTR